MNRIELIRHSLRCFVLGLLGLVPLLGIPASAMALVQFRFVWRRRGDAWNPAERYLIWGVFLAQLGLLLSLVTSLFVGFVIIENWARP